MDFENTEQKLIVKCHRDRRFKSLDPETGTVASINRYVRRQVQDLPIAGYPCVIDFELAQVRIDDSKRLVEHCDFVAKGSRYTRRFCQMISGLCRHMSIQTVSKHLKIRWETVKNIDKDILAQSLPALDPTQLKDLTLIGVDEVPRAKGHDYMTVVYDMVSGQLIWVEHGRTADVLITFFNQLPEQTANGIKAVAMDMGKAYQKAVRTALPNADIVFDRFHVMQNFSKVIQRQRRTEFRKATDHNEKGLIKGSLYLLLMNAEKMSDKQSDKLDDLLEVNKSLCTLYMMKEQLQALWSAPSFESMDNQLEAWCQLADSTNLFALQDFAKSLRAHREGICNYAKYRLTSARIEAGNVAIGMIRKRARGIKDTNYFKLKIRQTSVKETHSIFYPNVKLT